MVDDVWLCASGWLLVVVATSPVLLQGVVVVEVEDGGGSSRWALSLTSYSPPGVSNLQFFLLRPSDPPSYPLSPFIHVRLLSRSSLSPSTNVGFSIAIGTSATWLFLFFIQFGSQTDERTDCSRGKQTNVLHLKNGLSTNAISPDQTNNIPKQYLQIWLTLSHNNIPTKSSDQTNNSHILMNVSANYLDIWEKHLQRHRVPMIAGFS